MGCCNDPAVTLPGAAPNPAWHVNYAKGMVLGVDDFTQEFAYLAGRDQWALRDTAGYGTTGGLAVSVEDTAEGPRVRVSPGAAVVPSGNLVCVANEQCGVLNKWLAKPENALEVNVRAGGGKVAPPAGTQVQLDLYLCLSYADCLTLSVPIPGEPCRSSDELMAFSRVADDYKLDFRLAEPTQTEEDALRDFVAWLHLLPMVDGTSPPIDEASWIAGLRAAVKPWLDAEAMSPPLSPPPSFMTLGDYLFDSPPTTLLITRAELRAFLRVALRFWVTVLRPFWMARKCGTLPGGDDDTVLLADLQMPVVRVGNSTAGAWVIDGTASALTIDESRRPVLVSQRLLQEFSISGWPA